MGSCVLGVEDLPNSFPIEYRSYEHIVQLTLGSHHWI